MDSQKKPYIDIDIDVEVLEERVAPGIGGTFAFGIRAGTLGIRFIRADNHAFAGIRRAAASSGTIFLGKG